MSFALGYRGTDVIMQEHLSKQSTIMSKAEIEERAKIESEKEFSYEDFKGKEKGIDDEHTGQALRGAFCAGFEKATESIKEIASIAFAAGVESGFKNSSLVQRSLDHQTGIKKDFVSAMKAKEQFIAKLFEQ